MSWKLAKKLKDTHLNPFSSKNNPAPAPSTTNKDEDNKSIRSSIDDSASARASIDTLSLAPVTKTPKPGILVVTFHEASGLSLPEKNKDVFDSFSDGSNRSQGLNSVPKNHGRTSGKNMPYALIDFDKVQAMVNSVSGTPVNPLWAGSNTQYKFDVSRVAELTVQLYIRHPHAKPGSGRSQDILLGTVRLTPRFETRTTSDGSRSDTDEEQYGVEWFGVQNGTGKLKIGVEYIENQAKKLTIDDFELLKVVGKGSFGKVMQVRKKNTNRIYALKTIRKAKIIARSEVVHTMAERSVLAQINNPFIVPLKFTFQSPEKLYFVLAFVNGGELFHHLTQEKRFDVNRARFYTAELLCTLECLHGFGVIYRDLKPENILLDYQGHIALCDFGLCKLEMQDDDSTNTFCGTPEYLAPEVLLGEGYNKTVDWWTLGVLLYEMLTGLPPYYDENTNDMYKKILTEPLHFPSSDIVPPAAKDLLTKLLNRRPAERLGANGSTEIKEHPFFHAIDWRKLLQRRYEPTFKPSVSGALDTKNISEDFTSEYPEDSVVEDSAISATMQKEFANFSYNRPIAGLEDGGGSIVDPSFMH